MTAEISRLRLTDGMISLVIDHKDPDRQIMMPDGLQLLQIHLHASFPVHTDHFFFPEPIHTPIAAGSP